MPVVYKQQLFTGITSKKYSHFSAEDFASDPYFQKWILSGDSMTNVFWEKWLVDNPEKKAEIDLAKSIISQLTFKEYSASNDDFDEVWKNIKETHSENIGSKFSGNKWYIGAAATIAIVVSSSIFLYNEANSSEENDIQVTATSMTVDSIQVGTDKAMLTLADGSEVKLMNGEQYTTQNANSNGKEIVYKEGLANKEIAYNYLTTPRGGQFFVKLSDGTQVWLNSESRIKYPVNFQKGETRRVELVYGEAYFDVSPSTIHNGSKFKVVNQSQEVQVLGTEFNIKAYKDESSLFTTLVEGKVSVNAMNKTQILTPNQQLKLDVTNNKTVISDVDVYREVSWKRGVFSFKNKSLKEIMTVLARWYEIEVVFNDKSLESKIFSGTLKKKLSINDILETITAANDIEYEITNKTVLLK